MSCVVARGIDTSGVFVSRVERIMAHATEIEFSEFSKFSRARKFRKILENFEFSVRK